MEINKEIAFSQNRNNIRVVYSLLWKLKEKKTFLLSNHHYLMEKIYSIRLLYRIENQNIFSSGYG